MVAHPRGRGEGRGGANGRIRSGKPGKHRGERENCAGQDRGDDLPGGAGARDEPVPGQHEVFHGSFGGIDDPVLADAESLVEQALGQEVVAAGARRKDLDDEVGRTVDAGPRQPGAGAGQKADDVGLHEVLARSRTAIGDGWTESPRVARRGKSGRGRLVTIIT